MAFQIRIVEAKSEVRVRNVQDDDIRLLENMAANMAQSLSSFLRGEFKRIIREAPPHLLLSRESERPETLDEAIEALTKRRNELLQQQNIKKGPGRPKKIQPHNPDGPQQRKPKQRRAAGKN